MKQKIKAFTLIELLVVIVIIGILATVSTATFSGYFAQARDAERQAFIRNAQQILIASQVSADTPDYRLGGTTVATVRDAVRDLLEDQGYKIPEIKNGINYFLVLKTGDATIDSVDETDRSTDFILFACKESALGTTVPPDAIVVPTQEDLERVAFTAGTKMIEDTDWGFVWDVSLTPACANPPNDLTVRAGPAHGFVSIPLNP